MVTLKTLDEITNDAFGAGGIFNYINLDILNNDKSYLNFEYYGNHSGSKYISPLVSKILGERDKLDDNDSNNLANICLTMFRDKWSKMFEALNSDYNPIHNYDMTETERIDRSKSNNSNSITRDTTTDTTDSNDSTYAFNSNTDTPTDKNNTRNTNTSNSNVDVTINGSDDEQRTLNRAGNIGVTTSQKMVNDELELRKFILYDEVFRDIDKVLTIDLY